MVVQVIVTRVAALRMWIKFETLAILRNEGSFMLFFSFSNILQREILDLFEWFFLRTLARSSLGFLKFEQF